MSADLLPPLAHEWASVKLERWARYIAARFNAPVYLVGSALTKADPRDIDVRVVIPDDDFAARYGCDSRGWLVDGPPQAWIDDCGKLGSEEARRQRLNIDFQVYPARHCIQYLDRPRIVLASPSCWRESDPAAVVRAADYALADVIAARQEVPESPP